MKNFIIAICITMGMSHFLLAQMPEVAVSKTLKLNYKASKEDSIFQSKKSTISVHYNKNIWSKLEGKYGAEVLFKHEDGLPMILFTTSKEKDPISATKVGFLAKIKSDTKNEIVYSKKVKINKKTGYIIKYHSLTSKGSKITYIACLLLGKEGSLQAMMYGMRDDFMDYEEEIYTFMSGIIP
jgi:hypothetical protein